MVEGMGVWGEEWVYGGRNECMVGWMGVWGKKWVYGGRNRYMGGGMVVWGEGVNNLQFLHIVKVIILVNFQ